MTDSKLIIHDLIRVYGIVQGVGFRPFIARTAAREGIFGNVCNRGPFVEIHAQGEERNVSNFIRAVKTEAPERSAILKVEVIRIGNEDFRNFKIIMSNKIRGEIFVSPDIATCPKCKKELFDPSNRRYLHPFINCTACGPRLTILDSMPYDRERTSMAEFPMCPTCAKEYTDPADRRYDAQPVCCNDCGPTLLIPGTDIRGNEALLSAREVIRNGGIAAIKGIGGFHLCCDALNENAVMRLRKLKDRPYKPFAIMVKDLETARRECVFGEEEEKLLDGPQKPIILLNRTGNGKIVPQAAPGNPTIGIMLPYAPVQMLIFSWPDNKEMSDCLIMTSGNPSGAPICHNDEEAVSELSSMCDIILSNDRKIRIRADDSVMMFFENRPYMVRRSRGFAPLPFILSRPRPGKQVLAIGGELKNTFCIADTDRLYLSPYIGDLADVRSVNALDAAVKRMETLLEITPKLVVCDMHPKYNSTAYAESIGLPVLKMQHHYAHILSCMAENDFEGETIGVSFDGTGYGTDKTIWGGEFLRCSCSGFERLGSIEPFQQAGGDRSVREGWRIAVALLFNALGEERARDFAEKTGLCSEEQFAAQLFLLKNGVNSVRSTSEGRMFDAVSALLGIKRESTFEGEASTALEYAADRNAAFPFAPEVRTGNDGFFTVGSAELIPAIADAVGKNRNADRSFLSGAFHDFSARSVLAGCMKARETTGLKTVALSGGVFQNRTLVTESVSLLREKGFRVLTHSLVPPNDGGIALGQAAYGMSAEITESQTSGRMEKLCV